MLDARPTCYVIHARLLEHEVLREHEGLWVFRRWSTCTRSASSTATLRFLPCTLHPTPYTLHLTPYTLHPTPTPYTLHPTPYTLQPAPYTLHPTSYTLDPVDPRP
eukprot:3940921-Rhodomonas_salina.2